MYNYGNQYAMLVGASATGMMSPAGGSFEQTTPSGYRRPDGFNDAGCGPCGPYAAPSAAQSAADAERYDAWCRQQQAMTAAAARVAIMKELPTVAAPANSTTVGGVLAGGLETITVTTPVPLCIIDWDVSRICSSFFTAVSLVSALVPYLVTSGEMQLDVFASDAIHPTTNFPQLIPGTPMVLIVHNISAEPHAFFSTFHGIRGPGQGPCLGYNQGLYGGAY